MSLEKIAETAPAFWPSTVIGGVRITRFSRAEWVQLIVQLCLNSRNTDHRPIFLSSANGNVVSKYATDPNFRQALEQADGIDADGMSLVLASRFFASDVIPERCATTDFFHDLARAAESHGLSFFFLGSTDEVMHGAVERIRILYPSLQIAGSMSGYFTLAQEKDILVAISDARPDVLWLGLGVPKEQLFVARNLNLLSAVGVIKTCGGLFDFISGRASRAPVWMQRSSLEWLYRTLKEPRRLFWRYFVTNIHAMFLIVSKRLLSRPTSR